jgi:hypothetical protein
MNGKFVGVQNFEPLQFAIIPGNPLILIILVQTFYSGNSLILVILVQTIILKIPVKFPIHTQP